MNDFNNIKRLLMPAIKGSPFIIACFVIALVIAFRSVLYTNPTYESTAIIKLDDIGHGISSATLYKDFDLFANTNKIATEVEVLKSRLLIVKAIEEVDFDVAYYRVGKMRTSELYHESPFLIKYDNVNERLLNKRISLQITTPDSIHIRYENHKGPQYIQTTFNQEIENDDFKLEVLKNEELLNSKPEVDLIDLYQFQINTTDYIADHMIGGNLDVTAVDKDVAVIRLSFTSEVPEKTAFFVNTLASIYVNDYIESRVSAAGKTAKFIDQQLSSIGEKLRKSERDLERFRIENNIINTKQETETDLRKIAQLKIQLANLEMNEAALDSLQKYIGQEDANFLELAPNFEAFNDLLSTELIKKIKRLQDEKKELLLKYTPDNEKVTIIDEKIEDIIHYLKESIRNTRNNLAIKRSEIERTIKEAEEVFIGLPTKEKQMIILEREFSLNQKIFNFLTEKKTEASIAEAATMAFHRVIQQAAIPRSPVSPKKTLTMIVAGMLGLIIGITITYLRVFIARKIVSREELEKITMIPIAGLVKKSRKADEEMEENFQQLATNMTLQNEVEKHNSIVITSTIAGEGKTYVALHLASAFAQLGWKVALVDLNLRNPSIHEHLNYTTHLGISDMIMGNCSLEETIQHNPENSLSYIGAGTQCQHPMKLINHNDFDDVYKTLESSFDVVIYDSPATAIVLDAIKLIKLCNQAYYIVRANFTKSHFLQHADLIAEEYKLDNLRIILNGAHRATNFNGNYTGSHFNYRKRSRNIFKNIRHYIQYYM